MSDEALRYEFGKNWSDFEAAHITDERIRAAQTNLLDFLGVEDLGGRSFLDIGCGSGIHSLAALRAGARSIVSFDYDPDAVATTRRLWEGVGRPERWRIEQGSVLDDAYVSGLEPADIVYSWGVLHHTGAMWEAVRSAGRLVADDGRLFVALYTKSPLSPRFVAMKQRYNRSSALGRRRMELWYALRYQLAVDLKHLRNPLRRLRGSGKRRGMAWITDLRDWLGGYPYEDAAVEEVVGFARNELAMKPVKVVERGPGMCSEYLFERS
jgi:SAM-dependent methyltransferase